MQMRSSDRRTFRSVPVAELREKGLPAQWCTGSADREAHCVGTGSGRTLGELRARFRPLRPPTEGQQMSTPDPLAPAQLGPLRLRNRIIKAATFEGMTPGALVSDALIDYHRQVSLGGVGM